MDDFQIAAQREVMRRMTKVYVEGRHNPVATIHLPVMAGERIEKGNPLKITADNTKGYPVVVRTEEPGPTLMGYALQDAEAGYVFNAAMALGIEVAG